MKRSTIEAAAAQLIDAQGVADLIGLDYVTVRTYTIRRADFPAPIARYGRTNVWWTEDVARWNTDTRRPHPRTQETPAMITNETPTQEEAETAWEWSAVDHPYPTGPSEANGGFWISIRRSDDGRSAYFETDDDRWIVTGTPDEIDAAIGAAITSYED